MKRFVSLAKPTTPNDSKVRLTQQFTEPRLQMLFATISLLIYLSIAFLRALPRFFINRRKLFLNTSDTWYHMMLAEEIRQNNHKLPKKISRFLLSDSITYPPLFHILLSYLTKRQRIAIEPFLGGIFDGLVGVGLFFTAYVLIDLDLKTSLFVSLLFVFSPYALGSGYGPRATLGTPRVFGQFLFFVSLLMLLQFLATGDYLYVIAAIALGSLIFLASMFSSQAYVFILIIWSTVLLSAVPLFVLCGSYLLSLLISGGQTWNSSKGHVLHLRIMAKTFWKGRFLSEHIQQRNRLSDLRNLPKQLFTSLKKNYFLFYVRNTFLIVLFQIPVVSFYVYSRFDNSSLLTGSALIHLSDTFVGSAILVFIAVSTRPLLFLGEAERYIEHVSPFCCLFVGLILQASGKWEAAYGVLLYSIFLYLINVILFVYLIRTRNSVEREQNTQAVLDWINSNATERRFAVLPNMGLNILIACLTSSSVLFGRWKDDCSPAVKSLKDVESDEFRLYRANLFEMYAIDYVIIPSTTPLHSNLSDLKNEFPVVFRNASYCILQYRQS